MNLPNAVIAGAPKCGTTSLFNWLSDHPEVCGSSTKETRYLIDEGYPFFKEDNNYIYGGVEGYQFFFNDFDKEKHKIILEATPDYIYQKIALNVLADLPSKPDVIFILRKPSERIYSLFQFARNNMAVLDKEISFSQFVDKILGDNVSSFKERGILRCAIRHSRYVKYISKWFLRFGKERIHIFLFEDLKKDPLAFIERLSAILGIDKTFYEHYDFSVSNRSHNFKSIFLHKIANIFHYLIPDGPLKVLLKKLYFSFNTLPIKILSSRDKDALLKLDDYFLRYNISLAEEADIDLSPWNV